MNDVVMLFYTALESHSIVAACCDKCPNQHTFVHVVGPKHYRHLWSVVENYDHMPYEQAREHFWQEWLFRGGGMRFNHLDGAVEVWRGAVRPQVPPRPQPPSMRPGAATDASIPLPPSVDQTAPNGGIPPPPPPRTSSSGPPTAPAPPAPPPPPYSTL
eukprot:CAMPEP_0170631576 /NCGR_PEP_ID=MMETSP0224-20130122/34731_1 /TAXON_ID=285029 /ORGANISM="Togula jolla, Strain CCCM 725" /LENGTH=157 /DNA_ID=CAMNT_0010959957 /DNA_START=98 /DNA_END=568 /DNA_ORIENTATION=+